LLGQALSSFERVA